MSGKYVKEVLKKHKITIADLSRKMSMRNPQQLHAILKSGDIKFSRVKEISALTGISIVELLGLDSQSTYSQDNSNLQTVSDTELISTASVKVKAGSKAELDEPDESDELKREICNTIDRFYSQE